MKVRCRESLHTSTQNHSNAPFNSSRRIYLNKWIPGSERPYGVLTITRSGVGRDTLNWAYRSTGSPSKLTDGITPGTGEIHSNWNDSNSFTLIAPGLTVISPAGSIRKKTKSLKSNGGEKGIWSWKTMTITVDFCKHFLTLVHIESVVWLRLQSSWWLLVTHKTIGYMNLWSFRPVPD